MLHGVGDFLVAVLAVTGLHKGDFAIRADDDGVGDGIDAIFVCPTLWSASIATVNFSPFASRKCFTCAGDSPWFTPTSLTRSAGNEAIASISPGRDLTQGPHQEAQKSSTTTCPFWAARSKFPPSSSGRLKLWGVLAQEGEVFAAGLGNDGFRGVDETPVLERL